MNRIRTNLALLAGGTMMLGLLPLELTAQTSGQGKLADVVSGIAEGVLQQELEKRAYNEASSRGTAAGWRDFLQRYPDGRYALEAQAALDRLELPAAPTTRPAVIAPQPVMPAPQVTSPVGVENALGLSRARKADIQRQLTALGFDTGGQDGIFGRNSRSAISGWQRANGQEVTGYLTAPQVDRIATQAAGMSTTVTPAPTPAPGMPAHPVPAGTAEGTEDALGLGEAGRREVQLRLTLLGYGTNGTNGVFGPGTRSAMRDWQRMQGLPVTGYLTADQLALMRRQTGG